MRLTAALACASIVAAIATQALAVQASEAFGVWRHPENGSLVRMYKCSGGLCAKVIKVRDPSRKDVHNPDPALRSRAIEGIVIMRGARKTGQSTWKGQLYNTRDGETYSGVITVKSQNKLELEGCVLGGLLCKGVTWTRVR
jgi:uncharacterized protein (DUF2147 family)